MPFSNWTDCCLNNINLPSSEGTFLIPTPRQTTYLSVDKGLGEYVFVHAGRVELGFQGVAAAARERIRLHLDLEADDPEAEVRRLVAEVLSSSSSTSWRRWAWRGRCCAIRRATTSAFQPEARLFRRPRRKRSWTPTSPAKMALVIALRVRDPISRY